MRRSWSIPGKRGQYIDASWGLRPADATDSGTSFIMVSETLYWKVMLWMPVVS